MSHINDGGPAFPVQESIISGGNPVPAASGMSLLDWLASQENLSDWDSPDVVLPTAMAETLAGPRPVRGWKAKTSEDWIAMLKWDATWRSKIKYIRAEAMLKVRNGLV